MLSTSAIPLRLRNLLLALLIPLAPMEVRASEPVEEEQETPRLSFGGGVDFTNAYFFRGIVQEDQGLIVQPAAKVGIDLGDLWKTSSLTLGTWNSLHSEETGAGRDSIMDEWYECDLYATLAFAPVTNLTVSGTYTAYISPNDAFRMVSEVAVGAAYADGHLWNDKFAINPSVLLAIELDNSAFGPDEGVYLELGVAPGFALIPDKVNLAFPLKIALGLDGYYEAPKARGSMDDELFGYASVGAVATIPLKIADDQFGQWSISAGVECLFLGSNLEEANNDDRTEVIGRVGLSFAF